MESVALTAPFINFEKPSTHHHHGTAMAAATTAAITSPLMTKLKTTSKTWPMFLRLTSSSSSSSSSLLSHQMMRTPLTSGKWPMMKISASVAQKDTAVSDEEKVISSGNQPLEETNSSVHTKLYFGNLPYLCDSAQLAGIIQDYGSPELVEVLYDRDTGKSRGFAFVTMSSIEDCEAVIENLDGKEYGGRTLRVNFSDKPKPKEPLYPETEYKLFVGNLSWSVTSESLTEMFSEHGNVVGARVLYDGETGRSRGYGFVSYSTKSEMETALQILNGAELEGRSLRVSLAQGKKQ